MKQKRPNRILTFLLVLLLWAGTVNGQTYLLESFDGETFPPTGWTQSQVSGTGLWDRWTIGTTPNCMPYSGAGMLGFYSYIYPTNTSAVIISPAIDLSDVNSPRLQFWMYRDEGIPLKQDYVDFYVNTSAELTDAFLLGTINRPITAEPIESADGWYKYEFEIPEFFSGSENYILLKATSKFGMNMFVDEVRVYRPEAANGIPTSFGVEGVTQTSMTVKWTDNSTNETGFKVYISTDDINYSQYGSDITSTTQAETGTEYSQAIINLLPGTTYYFRISAYYELESDYLTGNQATLEAGQIVSTGTGNWNSTSTWSSGTIPTISDNILIETGHTVTLNATGSFNNLTVNGTLAMQSYTLSGAKVDVAETGSISVTSGTNANLSVTGNITNNGTMNFYTSDAIVGRITFSGTNAQTFNANCTTNLGFMVVNKGNSFSNIAEIVANGTFSIRNGSTTNFLTLTNGTLKISGTAAVSNNVFSSIGYTISESCGFWLNNPNFEVLGQNAPTTVNGLLRISDGIYNVGSTANNSLSAGAGATFIIDGGTLNLASRLYTTNAVSFTLSDGEVNVNLQGNTENTASFGLVSSNNTINISGGTINLVKGSEATTPLDYALNGSSLNITGGVLQAGIDATPSPFEFRIQGNTTNLVIDNTTNSKSVLLNASTNVYGDITVNTGTTLNTQSNTIHLIGNSSNTGNIINNGLITNNSSTGSNLLTFIGAHGPQNTSGAGTIGDATTPFAGITISNSAGVTFSSGLVTNRINLLKGIVSGANNITLGNGVGSNPVVHRGGSSSSVAGSFDQAPTISAGSIYSVTYSTALDPITTGFELPTTLSGTLELASNQNITLGSSVDVGKIKLSSNNSGNIVSTESNFPTITGTLPTDLIIQTGNTGYINGPLALTLPASLASGSTYLFPIKKGENNFLELVNPTSSVGGQVVIRVEVFDESSGGSEGLYIQDASLQNRYWKAEIISEAENFTSTKVRVTQDNPSLTTESGLAKSSTLTGAYDLVSTEQPVENKISSDVITELGYFAIGVKELSQIYQSSTTSQLVTDIIMRGEQDNLIIGIEIVTTGNSPALQVSSMEFSTNGTTNPADITGAKLYYTGTNSTFTTGTKVGETILSPDGTFSINPAQELLEGTNYFWLAFDIAENATDKNVVDAECIGITIGEDPPYTPTVTAPEGSRTIRSYLSGTYLLGTGGDYSTITEAIADLNLVGVNAPVYLMLIDENYSTAETFPLTVNEIISSSSNNYVIIKPATGVTTQIVGTSNNPLFLVNASNFGIDGSNTVEGATRDLTITNNGTAESSGIVLTGSGSENLSFKNLNGIGGASSAGFGITLDGVNNAEVLNCSFSKSLIGIQTKGSSSQILISGNELGSMVTESKIHTSGIVIENTTSFNILNNNIIGVLSGTTSTSSGIKISGSSTNGNIAGNEIRDIKNTLLPGYGSNGIWINSSNTSSNIKVYNNVISDIASYGYSDWDVGRNGYGIAITGGEGYGVYFNTIHLNTDQTSSNSRTAGLYISPAITTANTLDVRNNIIINSQTIGTRYAVYCGASKTVFADINHNDYHAPSAIGFITFVRTSLANWQTGTGKDANSLNVPAYFTSDTDLSLISNMNCALDGAATPISGITDDFNGALRDTEKPDMGAFEFTSGLAAPEALDESICIGEEVPPLTATTVGTAKWYSDAELLTLVHTGNTFETGHTEVGSYTYYVTDNHGTCISDATPVTLFINPLPTISVTDDFAVCFGDPVTLTATGDADVYEWDNDVENGVEFVPIETLTYTVTAIVTTTGCQSTDEVTIIVKPLPEPTISTLHNLIYCPGDEISTTFTIDIAGDSYQWLLNGDEIPEANASEFMATTAGVYSVVVTDDGCPGLSNELTVRVVEEPIISTEDNLTYCEGETINTLFTIDITGDSYQWLINDTEIVGANSNTYTANMQGIFSVEMLVEGCTVTSNELEIVVFPVPEPIISTEHELEYCDGDPVNVLFTINITGDSYQWLLSGYAIEDAIQSSYTATNGGIFSVEVTENGCSGISNALEIVVYPIPTPSISTEDALTYCEGDEIIVEFTVDMADAQYQWYEGDEAIEGATQQTYIANASGTYFVEVTVNGCSGISNAMEIMAYPVPTPSISTEDALTYCEGDEIIVEFTVDMADAIYQWYEGDVAIEGATQQTYIANASGTYFVEVTVNGCTGISNAMEIMVYPIPTPSISTEDALTYCEGDEISVEFTVDIADAIYQWYEGDVAIEDATQQTYIANAAGTYFVEVTVNGCTGISNTMEIMVYPIPTPSISTEDALTYCEGDEIIVEFTVDIADAIYQWYEGDGAIEGATQQTYIANASGTYFVEVTVDGCTGISNEKEIVVYPIPEPLLEVPSMPSTFCEGDEILFPFEVDIADADFYQWYLNDEPIPGANDYYFDATEAGEYYVEVTVNGCTGASDIFIIGIIESVLPIISTDDPLTWCANDQVLVTFEVSVYNPDEYEVNYQWLLNGDPIAEATSNTYYASVEGVYSVETYLPEFMCTWISNELEVVVNSSPIVSIATDTIHLEIDEEYLFDAGEGFTTYLWFDESSGQTYLFNAEFWGVGTFDVWVEVTNDYGCSARDSAVVVVLPLGVDIYTPWAFNIYPNPSDGKFYFIIEGLLTPRKLQVSIYNSTGHLVFQENYSPSEGEVRDVINIQGKAKGVYIIKIFDGAKSISRRIILK